MHHKVQCLFFIIMLLFFLDVKHLTDLTWIVNNLLIPNGVLNQVTLLTLCCQPYIDKNNTISYISVSYGFVLLPALENANFLILDSSGSLHVLSLHSVYLFFFPDYYCYRNCAILTKCASVLLKITDII